MSGRWAIAEMRLALGMTYRKAMYVHGLVIEREQSERLDQQGELGVNLNDGTTIAYCILALLPLRSYRLLRCQGRPHGLWSIATRHH